jgi:hypothetical protein
MQKILLFILILFAGINGYSQELNCTVDVLTGNIQITNKDIFEDLKKNIFEFLNNRKWTGDKVAYNEKINCNIVLDVTKYEIDQFQATLSVQSTRTAFGSTYNTRLLNHVERDVAFQYAAFQTLDFQENTHTNNLTSVLAFYAYIILGMDYDTYGLKGGTPYFQKALAIRSAAINDQGWGPNDGNGSRNRYYLIDNILDNRFASMRSAMYMYHMNGLDVMATDVEKGRKAIYEALKMVQDVYNILPNSFILQIFFSAKKEELVKVFSKVNPSQKNQVIDMLSKMDPANRSYYEEQIKKK